MKTDRNNIDITTVIEPPGKWHFFDFSDFVRYHELLFFLTWRDVKVRYKQAALGIGWAVIQPIMQMVVFSFIFGRMGNFDSEGIPYPIFTFLGILPWNLFSKSLSSASNSMVKNAGLLKKVYVPRLILPIASILPNFIDFLIGFCILAVLIIYYGIAISWGMLVLIPLTALAMLSAVSVGLWLAAINVKYRDVKQVTPFLISLWMWITPVAYSSTEIPEGIWRYVYSLNPMVGVVNGFRWAIVGGKTPGETFFISTAVMLILLIFGLIYFRKTEAFFADIV